MDRQKTPLDKIGEWSETKLEIVRKYAAAYSRILSNQHGFAHYYIDGFAGAGEHVSKATGAIVPGSPLNAINVVPPFDRYFLIDRNRRRVANLKNLIGARPEVEFLRGDCNALLLDKVFPEVRWEQKRRALCLLDPYGVHLKWEVIAMAGGMRTIDMLLNVPIMDMNMNALLTNPRRVSTREAARMTTFWGDESWKGIAYRPSPQGDLFGQVEREKLRNDEVVEALLPAPQVGGWLSRCPETGRDEKQHEGCSLLLGVRVRQRNCGPYHWGHFSFLRRTSPEFLAAKTMSDHSAIEWTDATWNPVTGCNKVSPGCKYCYAQTFSERFRGVPGHPFEQGFDLRLWPERIELPLRWRTPRRIFVNSMSDLFHERVPDAFIEMVFATMRLAHWHRFQVLTKRPERMARFLSVRAEREGELRGTHPNVWVGTSIETQRYVGRAEIVASIPAAVRFLSCEPLLGPLDLKGVLGATGINWVIAGGESGHHARPMDADWVRSIRNQCRKARVAFFFKQWGGTRKHVTGRELDRRTWDQMPQAG